MKKRTKVGLVSASIAMSALFALSTNSVEAKAEGNRAPRISSGQKSSIATVSYYFDDISKKYSGEATDITLAVDENKNVTFGFSVDGEQLVFEGTSYLSTKTSTIYLLETMNGESSAITMSLTVRKIDDNRSFVALSSGSTIMDRFFDSPHIRVNLSTIITK